MKVINALHLTCDMLLFFAAAAMFSAFADAKLLVAAVLAAVFAMTLCAQQSESTALRAVCGLVPFAALFAAQNNAQLIATGIALLAWFAVVVSGKFSMRYETYRIWFGIPAFFVLILILISLGTNLTARRISVICGLLYLVLGIFVLRRKRMGKGAGTEAKMLSAAELAVGVTVGTAASGLVYLMLAGSAALIRRLRKPLSGLTGGIEDLLERLRMLLTGSTSQGELFPEDAIQDLGPVGSAQGGGYTGYTLKWFGAFEKALAIFVGVVLVALLVYLIVRRIRGSQKNGAESDETFEEGELPEEERALRRKAKKRGKTRPNSHSGRIREIYRQYLALAREHGIEIVKRTTSEDVLEASSEQIRGSEEDRQLRELYIKARYDDPEGVGSEDVKRAEELWKTIRERIENGR